MIRTIIVFMTTENPIFFGNTNNVVMDFKYDHDIRMAAAKALNDRVGSFRGWSVDTKGDLNKALKDEVDGALNIGNFKDFKDSMLSRTLREWYLRQQDLLVLLPPKPTGQASAR